MNAKEYLKKLISFYVEVCGVQSIHELLINIDESDLTVVNEYVFGDSVLEDDTPLLVDDFVLECNDQMLV